MTIRRRLTGGAAAVRAGRGDDAGVKADEGFSSVGETSVFTRTVWCESHEVGDTWRCSAPARPIDSGVCDGPSRAPTQRRLSTYDPAPRGPGSR